MTNNDREGHRENVNSKDKVLIVEIVWGADHRFA